MATAEMTDTSGDSSRTTRRVAGATGIMMAAILASRLLGLVRESVISGKFGQGGQSDVYYAAFVLPDLLFFLIAGGALSSAFIPVFTEYITHGREKEAWHIFSTVACVMFVLVSGFVILGEIFTPQFVHLTNYGFPAEKVAQTVGLTRIVLPAQLCFFLGGLLMGAQYARQKFLIPALGPLVYNVGIIFGGVVLANFLGVKGLVWGALGGAILGNFVLQLWAVARTGMQFHISFDWRHPDVMKVWKLMLPVILGLALPQVSIIFNRMFATTLGDGPLSAITRANQLMQVPLGLFAQAMGIAIFPTLSAQAAKKLFGEMRSTTSLGIRSLLFLTIPASAFMIVLAAPIIQVVLQHGKFSTHDTMATAVALDYYAIGIFAWSAQSILARGFYALQDSITPVVIGTGVTLLFIPMNLLFMNTFHLGYGGLALATTVAAILHVVVMTVVLRKRLGGIEAGRILTSTAKILVATAIAAAACWAVKHGLQGVFGPIPVGPHSVRALKLHAFIIMMAGFGVGSIVYMAAAVLLRISEVNFVTRMLRRRTRSLPTTG